MPQPQRNNLDTYTPKKRRKGQRPTAEEKRRIQDAFLAAFAQSANMRAACNAAGVERATVYAWQEHDETFSLRYKQAELDANDVIRAAIYQRAIQGVDKPLHYQGRIVKDEHGKPATVKDYSDTLLIFLAKSRMPEFRDKQQVDINANVSMHNDIPDDPEAAAIARALIKRVSSSGTAQSSGTGLSSEQ